MADTTIMLIRHAEKPDGDAQGVDEDGNPDVDSLVPRGWSRAGALAVLFAPLPPITNQLLAKPAVIYTSDPEKHRSSGGNRVGTHSRRPFETITPLANKLGIAPILKFTRGEEAAMVDDVKKVASPVLICWDHEEIPTIAAAIAGSQSPTARLQWPKKRFDVVWIFTSSDGGQTWTFDQLCQRLLDGDSDQPI
jgi:hypothetical protein